MSIDSGTHLVPAPVALGIARSESIACESLNLIQANSLVAFLQMGLDVGDHFRLIFRVELA
jgi:hypothetical protein